MAGNTERLKQLGRIVSEETRFECHQCGQTLPPSVLSAHALNCPRREYRCEYCKSYSGIFEEVRKHHIPGCPCRPVPCPNCCKDTSGKLQSVEQRALAAHLRICPDRGKVDSLMKQLREKREELENLQKEVTRLREQVSRFQVSLDGWLLTYLIQLMVGGRPLQSP